MRTKIAQIVLWPRDRSKTLRTIDFEPGKVNVITGWSQTGKSALIPIIDYCLGASKCAIPVGLIRRRTAWFGVLLEIQGRQLLLARREPGEKQETGEMFMDEGENVAPPSYPVSNCNVEAAKARLNQLAMLPSLDFSGGAKTPFQERPSVRDMMAFVFQAQHIVANPYTLFYKADTTEHREKLKTIFPFILGSIDANHLSLRHQLAELERELDRRKRQLDGIRKAAALWLAQLKTDYLQAREYGLLPSGLAPNDSWMPGDYVRVLSEIPRRVTHQFEPLLKDENTSQAVTALSLLTQDEESIAEQIQSVRSKLSRLESLSRSTSEYHRALRIQESRLEPVGWLTSRLFDQEPACPVCGSINHSALEEIERLQVAVRQVEQSSAAVTPVPDVFDKEIQDLRKHLRRLEEHLNALRTQRNALESRSEAAQKNKQTYHNILRFVGRLEQSLANYSVAQDDSDLAAIIQSLEGQIATIRDELNPEKAKARLEDALRRVAGFAQEYLRTLGVERPDDPVELDITNLSVRVSDGQGRRDFLWEIGSGSNWLGYHVALLLGLHRHFLNAPQSPVPSVLVLDQPSQVYFPDRWPTDPRARNPGQEVSQEAISEQDQYSLGRLDDRNDDIEGVRKIFQTLSNALRDTSGNLQIIVIDHADTPTWAGIDHIHVAARWRSGSEKLVPPDWGDET
jgi:hypothetical protein